MGFFFEYNVPLEEIEPTLLAPFDTCISELQGVHHVQRYVMERLFWPNPELVRSVTHVEVGWSPLPPSSACLGDQAVVGSALGDPLGEALGETVGEAVQPRLDHTRCAP